MRMICLTAGILILVACAGCDATGSAHGGGGENGSYGRVKVGVPF